MSIVRSLASIPLLALLAGCAFLEVATTSTHKLSEKSDKDEQVVVQLIHKDGSRGLATNASWLKSVQGGVDIPDACKTTDPKAFVVGPIGLALIGGAFDLAYNEGVAAVTGWLKDQVAAFTQSYGNAITVPELTLRNTGPKSLRCLHIARLLPVSDKARSDEKSYEIASEIYLEFAQVPDTASSAPALQIRPVLINLSQAKARTDSAGTIDLAITVGINIVQDMPDVGDAVRRIAEANVVIGKNKLPKAGEAAIPRSDFEASSISALFARPKNEPRPATIAVAVTEIGHGAKAFSNALDALGRNSQTIGAALGGALNERLKK